MKIKSIFKTAFIGIVALTMFSCEDAKDPAIDNLLYINEASTAKSKDVTLQDGITRTSLTVRLAKSVDADVTATLSLDEALLDEYNKKNETSYKMPAKENITFPGSVTIKAGEISAEPLNVDIAAFDTEGVQYALPISVTNVKGGVDKSQSSSQFVFVLVKPLKQLVPKFTWYNGMSVPVDAGGSKTWDLSLPNYTLEWWSKMTGKYSVDGGYSINNQAIISGGSGRTELYIRFGDLIYSNGYSYKNNFLQVKTFGSQFDTGDPTKGFGLVSNEWYHFAITYDGGTGTTLLYKNGEVIAQLGTAVGQAMYFDHLDLISSGQQYFPDYCEMCQLRLWKTTRSVNQIKKGMYAEVEHTDPNLLLYLPMNEGPGSTVLHDVTGNGHDVEIGNKNTGNSDHSNVSWTDYLFAK